MPQTTVCRSMWPQLCHDLCMYTGYALDIWCHLRHVTLAVILITARNVRTIFVVEISVRPAFFTMLSCDEALCACAPVKCRARSRSWHAMPVRWRHARCILLSLIAIECEDITMVDASACCTLVLLLLKDLIAGMPTPWFVYILQYVNTDIFNVLEMTMAIIY